jgi:hypothetical protein
VDSQAPCDWTRQSPLKGDAKKSAIETWPAILFQGRQCEKGRAGSIAIKIPMPLGIDPHPIYAAITTCRNQRITESVNGGERSK